MAPSSLAILFFALLALAPSGTSDPIAAPPRENDDQAISGRMERPWSILQFYMHDQTSGSNPTTAFVTTPQINNDTYFGVVAVFDDLLTRSPSIQSARVGRMRGMFTFDSLSALSLLQSATVEIFGRAGSISLHGQNPFLDPQRELAVIGGSGEFRCARGYATVSTAGNEPGGLVLFWNIFYRLDC
ncbi:dirigent protein 21 [Selaginella moellendorffii]|uniref:dirigent protein 21 n=1 Tax=Selaginella moellendorffii TaxID=88036 RepID=UPI000D1C47D9|nr:dirigent protein 21 [Selaginella moellendorffii]|eukprot:XP_002964150.2 dirigent protein 21 [Selaginella moellendorffii]